MESARQRMYAAIDEFGTMSDEALKASQELDKLITSRQRVLTKSEVVTKFINDMDKKKQAAKRNEADCYLWDKGRMVGKKATKHRQRQPHWKSK